MLHQEMLFSTTHHPIVLRALQSSRASDLCRYLRANQLNFDLLLERHAGVLFRGFNVKTPEDFASVTDCFEVCRSGYVGGNSPRSRVVRDIFTSTEYPASERISLHNEMSYLPSWPRRLLFQCATPPSTGGQTTIAHSSDVLQHLSKKIRDEFRDRKLCYVRTMQPDNFLGKGWKSTYNTDNRHDVERIIRAQGSIPRWLQQDVLQVHTRCEALIHHPKTRLEVWFNQAEQWHPSALRPGMRQLIQEAFGESQFPHDCLFGDGSPIPDEVMEEIRGVLKENTLLFDWQEGDVLIIDNVLAMHGRESFTGPRKIHVFLAD